MRVPGSHSGGMYPYRPIHGGPGERPPVLVAAGRDERAHLHLGHQAAGGGHPPQRGEQGVLPDERGRRGHFSPGAAIAQTHRLHGYPGVERGLEDGPAEVPPAAAAPGAALREHRDGPTGPQRRADPGDGIRQGAQPVPFDEQHSGPRGQPARHGPPPYLGLGEHPRRPDRREQWDVQPGDVVGDQQEAALGGRGAGEPDPDAHGPHDRPAPAPDPAGREPAAEREQHGPREHQGGERGEPQHGPGCGHGGPGRLQAGGRGAGRRGQPDAHQAGTSERKCRR